MPTITDASTEQKTNSADFCTQHLKQALKRASQIQLNVIKNEIAAYDPYNKYIVDASTLRRIFAKHYKMIPLDSQLIDQIFRKFAINPKTCRDINYGSLLSYLGHLKDMTDDGLDVNSAPTITRSATTGCCTAQSPSYHRGDAKLISSLKDSLKSIKPNLVSINEIRQKFATLDRAHRETLSQEQIIRALIDLEIFAAIQPHSNELFQRCSVNNDQYNWSTFTNFLEKSYPDFADYAANLNGFLSGVDLASINTNGSASAVNNEALKLHPNIAKLIDYLKKFDATNSGCINASQARLCVQKYCDLNHIGIDSTLVLKRLYESVNETGTMLNLQIFARKLAYT